MISSRTKHALAQFLELQGTHVLVLLQKHGMDPAILSGTIVVELIEVLSLITEDQIRALLDEITMTQGDLHYRMSPKYRYDKRWAGLRCCLQLDGYVMEHGQIVPADPSIEEGPPLEDDLTRALHEWSFVEANDVIQKLRDSAESFRRTTPNYNSEAVQVAAWAEAAETLKTFATATRFVAPAEVLVAAGVTLTCAVCDIEAILS
jgi:hypothetical protein